MKIHPTICLLGGHLSPAQAVAQYLKKTHSDISVIFIGRKYAFSNQSNEEKSVEEEVMRNTTDSIYLLPFERLTVSPLTWWKLLRNVLKSYQLLSKGLPDVIVSFGGYVAVPVLLAALIKGIPFVIHEQTHELGLSNKILGLVAKKICVSFPEMTDKRKIFTGFPLRQEIISPPKECSLSISSKLPILYITGGTTGAVSINELVFPLIAELTDVCTIIHQTGSISIDKAQKIKDGLPEENKERYICCAYVGSDDAAWLMHHSSLLLGRSGANTVYELAVTKIPSLLIPLPVSAGSEQYTNAQWLHQYARTKILEQNELTTDQLRATITGLIKEKNVDKTTYSLVPTDGTRKLTEQILGIIQ